MRTVAPSCYKSFQCIADRCRHSCCVGWEIDIDEETLAYYKSVSGRFGRRLYQSISEQDGQAFFKFVGDERCPFLNKSGLCDIITVLGKEHLCQICQDHPRFRNFYQDRVEIGLGLCCEEAARLVLSSADKMCLEETENSGSQEKPSEEEKHFFDFRNHVFSLLQDRSFSVEKRLENLFSVYEIDYQKQSPKRQAQFYLSLERLDDSWTKALEGLLLLDEETCKQVDFTEFETAFEQFLIYLVYRHTPFALDDGLFDERLTFAADSYYLLKNLCVAEKVSKGALLMEDIIEYARQFSAEIEYSEDNLNRAVLRLVSEKEKL